MTKSKLADELDEREDEEDEDRSGFKITTPEFAYNNLKVKLHGGVTYVSKSAGWWFDLYIDTLMVL